LPDSDVLDVAVSNPSIGFHTIQLLLDSLTFDHDPLNAINIAVQALHFYVTNGRVIFRMLPELTYVVLRTARLPPSATSDLDLRDAYKAVLGALIPVGDTPFSYTHLSQRLNWPKFVATLISDHRLRGRSPVSIAQFRRLIDSLDVFDAAMCDYYNSYRQPLQSAASFHIPPNFPPPNLTPPAAAPAAPPDQSDFIISTIAALSAQVASLTALHHAPASAPPALLHAPSSAPPATAANIKSVAAVQGKPSPAKALPYDRPRTSPKPKVNTQAASAPPPVRIACPDKKCLITRPVHWLACHCGQRSPSAVVCLGCEKFAIKKCQHCLLDLDPSNSRPVDPIKDAAMILRLATAARQGNLQEFVPPRIPTAHTARRRGDRVHALTAHPPEDNNDPTDDPYDSSYVAMMLRPRTPTHAIPAPHSSLDPSLAPAIAVPGDTNILAADHLLELGCAASLTAVSSHLICPSGTTVPLSRSSSGTYFTAQLITIVFANGCETFLGIGFPRLTGTAITVIFDTAATISVAGSALTPHLCNLSHGVTITFADGSSFLADHCGDIPIRFHPHTSCAPNTTIIAPAPAPTMSTTHTSCAPNEPHDSCSTNATISDCAPNTPHGSHTPNAPHDRAASVRAHLLADTTGFRPAHALSATTLRSPFPSIALRPPVLADWSTTISHHDEPLLPGPFLDVLFLHSTTSYPIITHAPDCSQASFFACVETFLSELLDITPGPAYPDFIFLAVDLSWFSDSLTLPSPDAVEHSKRFHYFPYPRHPTRIDFPLSPVLHDLAAVCTSRSDLLALVLFHTADSLRHQGNNACSAAVRRDACIRFACGVIDTPSGPLPRLRALLGNATAELPSLDPHPYPNRSLVPLTDFFTAYLPHFATLRLLLDNPEPVLATPTPPQPPPPTSTATIATGVASPPPFALFTAGTPLELSPTPVLPLPTLSSTLSSATIADSEPTPSQHRSWADFVASMSSGDPPPKSFPTTARPPRTFHPTPTTRPDEPRDYSYIDPDMPELSTPSPSAATLPTPTRSCTELPAPSPSTTTFPAPTRTCIDLFMRELLASTKLPRPAPAPPRRIDPDMPELFEPEPSAAAIAAISAPTRSCIDHYMPGFFESCDPPKLPRPAPAPPRRIVHARASFIRASQPAAPTTLLPPVSSGPAPTPTAIVERPPSSTDRAACTRFCPDTHAARQPDRGDKRTRACINDLITPAAPGGRIREPELSLALAIRSYERSCPEPLLDMASIFRHLPIPAILAQFDISDAYLNPSLPLAPAPHPAPTPSLVPLDTPETSLEALGLMGWLQYQASFSSLRLAPTSPPAPPRDR